MIAFGPVPSRRLGMSLGVNNLPYKICTYSCVYCQVGKTVEMDIRRKRFYRAEDVYEEVKSILEKGFHVDYITFVPNGEPTLDADIGRELELLREFGIPIAILTNSSLIWMEDVREDLLGFDLVSLKIDAVSHRIWKEINRPHRSLKIDKILEGILEFSREFCGKIITETMIISGIGYGNEFERIAEFLREIKPFKSYISIPTRPPAEKWVRPADESTVNKAYQIFSEFLDNDVELLIGYEGSSFAFTGDVERDLIGITSVHPIREDALKDFLKRAGMEWDVVEKLIRDGKIREVEYGGKRFYIRRIHTT